MASIAARAPSRRSTSSAEPFTVDHFRRYAANMILDSGEPWKVEPFQLEVVEDVFAGRPEVWMVVPEGNGKTTLMGGLALYHADFTPQASVLMAAASRDQCGLLLGQASGFVYRTPGLGERFRVFEGYRRIRAHRTGGTIQVFAADDRTGDGVIPTLALVDELHRHPDMRLYRTWRGKLDKRDGQLVAISTAGDPESEFEATRERAKVTRELVSDGQHLRADCGELVMHEWAVRADQDTEDLEVVKAANPFSGVTLEKLRKRRSSPAMTPAHWARFVCNLATRAEGSWLEPGVWEACRGDASIPPKGDVYVGLDLGRKFDKTAVVLVHPKEGRFAVRCIVLDPPTDGTSIDYASVEAEVRRVASEFTVRAVVYDPWGLERSAQILEDEGLPMVEHPMTNERMVKASSQLLEAIQSQKVVHDGDPVLTSHVQAGHQKDTERGWRLAKNPKAKRPIDALVALCIAFSVASMNLTPGGVEWF